MSKKMMIVCCVLLAAVWGALGVVAAAIPFFSMQKNAPVKATPELLRALAATESDRNDVLKVRNGLLDPEKFLPNGRAIKKTETEQQTAYSLDVITDTNYPRPVIMTNQQLEAFENAAQIAIETRFLTCPIDLIAPEGLTLKSAWLIVPPSTDQKNFDGKRPIDHLGDVASATASVTALTEHYIPVYFRFLDNSQLDAVVNCLNSDSHVNLLQAPKLTIFNDQVASVCDSTVQQHCVGESDLTASALSAAQPLVEKVDSGTWLTLQPFVNADDSITLKRCNAVFRFVGHSSSYSTGPDSLDTKKTFPIPETKTFCINLPLTIPKDKTLMVCFPATMRSDSNSTEKKSEQMFECVIIRCNIVQKGQVAEIALKE